MNLEKIKISLNGKAPAVIGEVARELNIAKSEVFALLYKQKQNLDKEVVSLTAKPHPTAFERYGIRIIDAEIIINETDDNNENK
ncbi:MAG: hypothetical protein ACTHMM_21275 [Agriterribacter sp.]